VEDAAAHEYGDRDEERHKYGYRHKEKNEGKLVAQTQIERKDWAGYKQDLPKQGEQGTERTAQEPKGQWLPDSATI
jgi:hypothetical protein